MTAFGIAEYLGSDMGIFDSVRKGTSAIQSGLFLIPGDQSQASYGNSRNTYVRNDVEKKPLQLLYFNAFPSFLSLSTFVLPRVRISRLASLQT